MTPRRIVVCWPEPAGIRSAWAVRQRGFLLMSTWCAERHLYPGPGDVARLASPQGVREAAAALHVPDWTLLVAANQTLHGWNGPLLAVAAHIRLLDHQPEHLGAAA